jgi:hypothetical protein
VPPRFTRASAIQLKVSFKLSNSSAKMRREVIVWKGLREDQTSHPQKVQAIKRQKRETRLPSEYRLG